MTSDEKLKTDKVQKLLYCSFCGRSQTEVEFLIKSDSANICNECIELSTDIIVQGREQKKAEDENRIMMAEARKMIGPLSRNTDPKFCFITPTNYLKKYASQSEMHLVLAHLVDQDEEYAEFYRTQLAFKIMDNGAFELGESYDPDKLLELGKKCKANAIVLPDYPFESSDKTIAAAERLMYTIRREGFYTMFVPQSEEGNLEDWVSAYMYASSNEYIDIIGMSILGIPNALPHIPASYARVVMTQLLMDRGFFNKNKYHHYLGLNAGPALEIPPLIEMDAMDSMDSSGPVWAGICGTMYSEMADSYQPVRKISKHVNFQEPYTADSWVHKAIQHNMELTKSLLWKP